MYSKRINKQQFLHNWRTGTSLLGSKVRSTAEQQRRILEQEHLHLSTFLPLPFRGREEIGDGPGKSWLGRTRESRLDCWDEHTQGLQVDRSTRTAKCGWGGTSVPSLVGADRPGTGPTWTIRPIKVHVRKARRGIAEEGTDTLVMGRIHRPMEIHLTRITIWYSYGSQ